jgi:WD40 repeat protein
MGEEMIKKDLTVIVCLLLILTACGNVTQVKPTEKLPLAIPTRLAVTLEPTPPIEPATAPTEISIPEPETLLQANKLTGTIGPIYSLAWSPSRNQIASAGYKQVNIWDADSGELLTTLNGNQNFVWGVAWSLDGKYLAAADPSGTVMVWDGTSFAPLVTLALSALPSQGMVNNWLPAARPEA